jgi:hypothetical protein
VTASNGENQNLIADLRRLLSPSSESPTRDLQIGLAFGWAK